MLQIAATTHCRYSRGIEIVSERNQIAQMFYDRFLEYLEDESDDLMVRQLILLITDSYASSLYSFNNLS